MASTVQAAYEDVRGRTGADLAASLAFPDPPALLSMLHPRGSACRCMIWELATSFPDHARIVPTEPIQGAAKLSRVAVRGLKRRGGGGRRGADRGHPEGRRQRAALRQVPGDGRHDAQAGAHCAHPGPAGPHAKPQAGHHRRAQRPGRGHPDHEGGARGVQARGLPSPVLWRFGNVLVSIEAGQHAHAAEE